MDDEDDEDQVRAVFARKLDALRQAAASLAAMAAELIDRLAMEADGVAVERELGERIEQVVAKAEPVSIALHLRDVDREKQP